MSESKTMDPAELEALEPGPKGYQNEPGFRVVKDHPEFPGGYGAIVVPVVYCASDRHPEPQPRFMSPHEVARGRAEVADRVYGVRVHGTAVVGRRDDIREVAGGKVLRHVLGLLGRAVGRAVSYLVRLPGLADVALEKAREKLED